MFTSSSTSTTTTTTAEYSTPLAQYFVDVERPSMVNQINMQRKSIDIPLLCQDSMLSSIAQQHANDMAAIDLLAHDMPCASPVPFQFCSAASRLQPFAPAAENIARLRGVGSAQMALSQMSTDSTQFANMMNPAFLYIGVGMAMSPVSGKYFWAVVFSTGNYSGVSCVVRPVITVLDYANRTTVTTQPATGLNLALYPTGLAHRNRPFSEGLYCTMIPFVPSDESGVNPPVYPTLTLSPSKLASRISAKATSVMSTTATETTSDTLTSTATTVNITSLLATFTPTNAAQSSAQSALYSLLEDPLAVSAFVELMQTTTATSD